MNANDMPHYPDTEMLRRVVADLQKRVDVLEERMKNSTPSPPTGDDLPKDRKK